MKNLPKANFMYYITGAKMRASATHYNTVFTDGNEQGGMAEIGRDTIVAYSFEVGLRLLSFMFIIFMFFTINLDSNSMSCRYLALRAT